MKNRLNFKRSSLPLSHWFVRRIKTSKSAVQTLYIGSNSKIFQTNGYEVLPPTSPISKIINFDEII